MDYQILKDEITNDPLTRSYAAMTDAEIADDLNTVYRTADKTSITGDESFAATDSTQFENLTTDKQTLWMAFCGRETIDPFGAANVSFVQWVFGAGATLDALVALRVQAASRATELGLPVIKEGNIADARNF